MGLPKECNLLVAGVGGQGSILIGNILGEAAIHDGLEVWVAETFGMSQRGGSVVSHVRISNYAVGPICPELSADLVLGLEPMETLRVACTYLMTGGKVILNPRQVLPSDVISGLAQYPPTKDIIECLEKIAGEVTRIDAAALAEKSGNKMTVNTVMLGALAASKIIPVTDIAIENAVKNSVPLKTIHVNMKAFHLGYNAFKEARP